MKKIVYMQLLTKTIIAILVAQLLLSGCGFKLRGAGHETVAGQTVFLLSNAPYGLLSNNIRARLGSFVSVKNASFVSADTNGIQIINTKTQKETVSVDVNGRPAEYRSIISVNVSFHFNNKQQLEKQFAAQRDYRYVSNNSLAHDRELEMITAEMYDDLSARIVESFLRQLSEQRINETQN